jgi:hypothetical protein
MLSGDYRTECEPRNQVPDRTFTAVDQRTRSQVSIRICFSFGEFVRTVMSENCPVEWAPKLPPLDLHREMQ